MCVDVKFCKVDKNNNRDLYRDEFLPGVLAAFFGNYLQGNSDLLKYVTDEKLMPLPLTQLYFDVNCTST